MKPYHQDHHVTLHQGDALDVLRTLPDASVHAVVTDPPSGIAFMNMAWDDDRGGRAQWVSWLTEIMREVYRVLKPGAHGLVWALPRTSHWTACALEDAGFELKDKIIHLFGVGFPKALDISKAIDQELGATREVKRHTARPETSGTMSGKTDTRPWIEKSRTLGYHECAGDTPATPEAAQWDGYKTALKPAAEEWLLVRKPLSERNVARNVLVHGTGGLNIDACRVPVADDEPNKRRATGEYSKSDENSIYGNGLYNHTRPATLSQGRYPPHVVFSHAPDCTDAACVEGCPVRELGEQSGVSVSNPYRKSGGKRFTDRNYAQDEYTQTMKRSEYFGVSDTGTAARFFPCFRYEAKAPPSERKGSTHPTQKSVALMKWLVQLVTAEGQTVLDPFAGSGTTLVAARDLGRRAIGIEMDAAYCKTIVGRLAQQALPLFGEGAA
jgi:site-specific DNA-methyltransferase (adenine-specific)